jgi:hypothetical protein
MKYSNKLQTIWEILFTISFIVLIALLIFGTIENSKYIMPNYPYYLSGIALIIVILIGVGMIEYDE